MLQFVGITSWRGDRGCTGLHWEHLDEDISVKGLLLGIGDRTRKTPPSEKN
ncbi:MAG: hypothetical protein JSW27_02610 [Phycisphaerales bacterium]|nr:MAG: hypothetical protein JSW27_02610 [Phycisphaerales bacterium]